MTEPILFAHRGGARRRRENTIGAFRRALQLGATGLETDVRRTADGVVVLHHDAAVRRFGLTRRPIAALRRSELPARIPTLAELLALSGPDVPLSIDLKDPRAFEGTIAAGQDADALSRLWLCSSDVAELRRWRDAEPRVNLCLSAERPPPDGEALANQVRAAADAGAGVVNYRAKAWTRDALAPVREAGLAAFAWDANDRRVLREVLDLGIDGVYADRVDWLVATVRKLAAAR